ncbi:MAG TPA: DUF5132 domain-containing protein [Chloroflexota bacterium]|nr:DUF5132 domain-containing protein [Chloroflexota bacterium]
MGTFATFTLGVAAALGARAFAPALGRWARPAVRGAIKQGLILSQGAQVRAAGLREDLEDLVAEARAGVPAAPGTTAAPSTPAPSPNPSRN